MSDALPTQIGKYRVESALGEGGFGRVYKAFDPTVGRLLAIKVLTTRKNPEMLLRFQNEANAAGNLHHINIVTIYEYGTFQDSPFIAMEYLEGDDLNQLMYGRRNLSILEKVRIMTQVGEGLGYAHEHGVIHRDVKPPNIKVQPNGAVKIMDFGIARMTDNDSHRLTQQGDLLGSIRYMSPEQFTGGDVSELSDIFAYGVVFYELLAGVHPFDAADAPALMYKISECKPKKLVEMLPGCPPLLSQIVMRALEKDQDVRYQSLEDLLLEMRPLLNEFQKIRAAEIVKQTRELFEAGQIQKAQAGIREAIELDSSNAEAWELRERIQVAAHRKNVRPKVEALLKSAEEGLGSQQFREAIDSLESAARLDPTNILVQDQLKSARRKWEAAREAARLVGEAQKEFEAHHLTLAERLVAQAVEVDARNPQALAMMETIRRENERRERERRLKQVLESAQRLVKLEDYDSALEQLEGAKDLPDPTGMVAALTTRVHHLREEQARQERLRAEKQALRGVLKDSRFGDALPRLETLCAQFPEDADLAALLADTRQQLALQERSAQIRNATLEVSRLRAANRYSEAEAALRSLCAALPNDGEALAMLRDLEREHQQHARRETAGSVLRTAEQLRGEKRFEEAKAALDKALREFPDDRELVQARKKVEAEWGAYELGLRSRRAMSSAQENITTGKLDAAILLLEQASAEDPQNAGLAQLLRDTVRRAEQDRVSRAVDRVCAEARSFADAKEFDSAIEILRRAQRSYPEDGRLQGLFEALSTQKTEWEGQQRLADMIRTCTQLIREKRYPEAIFQLTSQLRKQPGEPTLMKLREQASAEWEAVKRSEALNRALTDIRAALDQGQFLEAELWLKHYQNEYATDPAYMAVAAMAQQALVKVERARQSEKHLQSVRDLEAQGQWDAALKVCETAIGQFPEEAQFAAAAARIRQEIDRQRREAHASKLNQAIRHAIENRDWTNASKLIDNFATQDAKNPLIAELRDLLQRERRRTDGEKAIEDAERSIARRDWAGAERALAVAATALPDSNTPAELKARIARGRKRDQEFGDAQKVFQKGRWADAEKLLGPLVSADASDLEAAGLLNEATKRRAAEEQQQAIAVGLEDAAEANREKAFELALEILEPLIQRYGANPDLERAQMQALEGLGRTAKAAKLAAAVRSAIEHQDFQGASAKLDELARNFSDEAPVAELRESLESARRSAADEILRQGEEAVAAGNWSAAERFLRDSPGLIPDGPRHAAIRAGVEQGRRRETLLEGAREALRKGRVDDVEPLLASLAGDSEAAALLAETRKIRAANEAAQAIAAGQAQAAKAVKDRQFEAALAVLNPLIGRYGTNAELDRLRKEAQAGVSRIAEASRLAAAVQAAIESRDFEGAARQLDDLAKRFSDAAPIASLRESLDAARRGAADDALRQGEEAVAREDWAGAERSLAASLKAAPEGPRHAAIRARIAQGKQRDAALKDAQQALQKGRAEDVEKLLGPISEDAKAAALLAEAQKQRAAKDAAQALATGHAQAAKAIRERQFEAALGVLDPLIARHGANAELDRLRQEALAGIERVAEANRLADAVKAAIESRDFEGASRQLDDLAKRFSDAAPIASLRESLDAARRSAADEALKQAEDAAAQKDWAGAERSLEISLKNAPEGPRHAAIRARIAEGRKREGVVKDAQQALQKGLTEDAEKLLSPISDNTQAGALLAEVQKQRAETEQAIAAGLKQAAKAIAERQFDAAANVVEPLIARYGSNAGLEGARRQIAEGRQRQQEAAALASQVRQTIGKRDWKNAAAQLDNLARRFAESPELKSLAEELGAARQNAGQQALAEATAAAGRKEWPAAETALAAAQEATPHSGTIPALRARIEQGKKWDAAVREARKAIEKGRFDDAEKLLRPFVETKPADSDAEALLKQARAQRAEAERAQAISLGLKQAEKSSKDRQHDAAVALLTGLVEKYGAHPEVDRELKKARSAVEAQKAAREQEEKKKEAEIKARESAAREAAAVAAAKAAEAAPVEAPKAPPATPVSPTPKPEQKKPVTAPAPQPKPQSQPAKAPTVPVVEPPIWRKPVVVGGAGLVLAAILAFFLLSGKKTATPVPEAANPPSSAPITAGNPSPTPAEPSTPVSPTTTKAADATGSPKTGGPAASGKSNTSAATPPKSPGATPAAPPPKPTDNGGKAGQALPVAPPVAAEVPKPAPIPNTPPPSTPACPSTNVNVGTYPEDFNGTPIVNITWSGELASGCTLVLQGRGASTGSFSGPMTYIPKVEASVAVLQPPDQVEVQSSPTKDNGYRITLRSKAPGALGRIVMRWTERK